MKKLFSKKKKKAEGSKGDGNNNNSGGIIANILAKTAPADPDRVETDLLECSIERISLHQQFTGDRIGGGLVATCFSYDSVQHILAVGTKTGSIHLFGSPGVEHTLYYKDITASVTQLHFATNMGYLLAVVDDNRLDVWDLKKKVIVHSVFFNFLKLGTIYVPIGSCFAFMPTEQGVVRAFNFIDGYVSSFCIPKMPHHHNASTTGASNNNEEESAPTATSMMLHPWEDNVLLVGYSNGLSLLWDIQHSKALGKHYLPTSTKGVTSICWHSSGEFFASGYKDGEVLIWKRKQEQSPIQSLQVSDSKKPIKRIFWTGSAESEWETLYIHQEEDYVFQVPLKKRMYQVPIKEAPKKIMCNIGTTSANAEDAIKCFDLIMDSPHVAANCKHAPKFALVITTSGRFYFLHLSPDFAFRVGSFTDDDEAPIVDCRLIENKAGVSINVRNTQKGLLTGGKPGFQKGMQCDVLITRYANGKVKLWALCPKSGSFSFLCQIGSNPSQKVKLMELWSKDMVALVLQNETISFLDLGTMIVYPLAEEEEKKQSTSDGSPEANASVEAPSELPRRTVVKILPLPLLDKIIIAFNDGSMEVADVANKGSVLLSKSIDNGLVTTMASGKIMVPMETAGPSKSRKPESKTARWAVFAGNDQGQVIAFDLESGKEYARHKSKKPSPCISLFALDRDGLPCLADHLESSKIARQSEISQGSTFTPSNPIQLAKEHDDHFQKRHGKSKGETSNSTASAVSKIVNAPKNGKCVVMEFNRPPRTPQPESQQQPQQPAGAVPPDTQPSSAATNNNNSEVVQSISLYDCEYVDSASGMNIEISPLAVIVNLKHGALQAMTTQGVIKITARDASNRKLFFAEVHPMQVRVGHSTMRPGQPQSEEDVFVDFTLSPADPASPSSSGSSLTFAGDKIIFIHIPKEKRYKIYGGDGLVLGSESYEKDVPPNTPLSHIEVTYEGNEKALGEHLNTVLFYKSVSMIQEIGVLNKASSSYEESVEENDEKISVKAMWRPQSQQQQQQQQPRSPQPLQVRANTAQSQNSSPAASPVSMTPNSPSTTEGAFEESVAELLLCCRERTITMYQVSSSALKVVKKKKKLKTQIKAASMHTVYDYPVLITLDTESMIRVYLVNDLLLGLKVELNHPTLMRGISDVVSFGVTEDLNLYCVSRDALLQAAFVEDSEYGDLEVVESQLCTEKAVSFPDKPFKPTLKEATKAITRILSHFGVSNEVPSTGAINTGTSFVFSGQVAASLSERDSGSDASVVKTPNYEHVPGWVERKARRIEAARKGDKADQWLKRALAGEDVSFLNSDDDGEPTPTKSTPTKGTNKLDSEYENNRRDLLGADSGSKGASSSDRARQAGNAVNDVKNTMNENKELLAQRGEKLQQVADKSANMAASAQKMYETLRKFNEQQQAKSKWGL